MLLKTHGINTSNITEDSNTTQSAQNSLTPEENKNNQDDASQEVSKDQEQITTRYIDKPLSSFSTKILSSDSSRQNNINITCSKINNTTVKNGATFSFCQTVGPSTSAKGYQKADIFDANGNKKKGLGGGNCQISTTLYNAVLAVPRFNCNRETST